MLTLFSLSPLGHSHDELDRPSAAGTPHATTAAQSGIPTWEVTARLNYRYVEGDTARSAILPVAGLNQLPQAGHLWRGSALTGYWHPRPSWQVGLGTAYSDSEQAWQLHDAWLGWQTAPSSLGQSGGYFARLGRFASWSLGLPTMGISGLASQGVLGDDHVHGNGIQLGQKKIDRLWQLSWSDQASYPGATQAGFWTFQTVLPGTALALPKAVSQVDMLLGWSPEVNRQVIAGSVHRHSRDPDCEQRLLCWQGQAALVQFRAQGELSAALSWRALWLWRYEEGRLGSGQQGWIAQDQQLWNSALQLRYQPQARWEIVGQGDWLMLDQTLRGTDARRLGQLAQLLPNSRLTDQMARERSQRYSLQASYQARQDLQLVSGLAYDLTRNQADTLYWLGVNYSIGMTW